MRKLFFSIKILKFDVNFELMVNNSTFSLYCDNDNLEFRGCVFNGCANYNNKDIVIYDLQKEFRFFEENLRKQVVKILKKEKFLK